MTPAPQADPPNTVRSLAGKTVSVAQKVGDDQWLVVRLDQEFAPRTVGDAEVSGWHKHALSEQCHDLSVEPWCVRPATHGEGHSSFVLPWDYQDLLTRD